jgi:hypothetical protein
MKTWLNAKRFVLWRNTIVLGVVVFAALGTATAEVGTVVGHWTDWSGTVDVKVYACSWVFGQHNTTTCSVDADYAIVGGGAEIWQQPVPGALLTASYPSDTGTWTASSKDEVYPDAHWLRAWAIGMKLTGVDDLRSQIHINPASASSPNTAAASGIQYGDILVGGGAYTTYSGQGELLTRSFPVVNMTSPYQSFWYAQSEDALHFDGGYDESGVVHSVSIGVPQCPVGFDGCLQAGYYYWNGPHGGGYQPSTIPQPDEGWATTSVGEDTNEDLPANNNRYLTTLIPNTSFARGSATVWSKDHGYAQSGWSIAYTVVVSKQ